MWYDRKLRYEIGYERGDIIWNKRYEKGCNNHSETPSLHVFVAKILT